ncbi:MAG: metal-dependent transcriptional regulator [Propioniciclava sp.]
MSDLIDTTEMYLRTVYELEEEGIPPLRARIAERLAQSGPTVSQTVQRMERDGLLVVTEDRTIVLTPAGRSRATSVMRKHRLVEVLLTEVIGLEWELVHAEACRWEHVISDAVEQRLAVLLSDPVISPYGNPIPASDALEPPEPPAAAQLARLSDIVDDLAGQTLQVVRLSEAVQADPEMLALFAQAGIRPGAALRAEALPDRVRLDAAERLTVDPTVVSLIFVQPPEGGNS